LEIKYPRSEICNCGVDLFPEVSLFE